jgi:hypothetical protein
MWKRPLLRCQPDLDSVPVVIATPHRPPQAGEGGQQHQRAIPRVDRLAQRVDLGTVRTVRSAERSLPAPLIRHGLRRTAPSSTAVVMIVLSRRSDLAEMLGLTPLSSRCLRQRRTWAG